VTIDHAAGGRGFWVKDNLLQSWMAAVARHVDSNSARPPTQYAAFMHNWRVNSALPAQGCVCPNLEAVHTSDGLSDWLREVLSTFAAALAQHIEQRRAGACTHRMVWDPITGDDIEPVAVLRVNAAAIGLLDGTWKHRLGRHPNYAEFTELGQFGPPVR
jgi:hypothetical protein